MVSVCMITYKHEQFIAQAIEGVLMQKVNFEVELIIADDASPDSTESIVQQYITSHPTGHWIKYTRHSDNKGMMPNFVWALQQCKGKYIALCEGDDYWTDPLKLQKQVTFLEEHTEYSLCGHQASKMIDEKVTEEILGKFHKSTFTYDDVAGNNIRIPTASIVFRNQLVFPDWIYRVYGGDMALIFLNAQKGLLKILDFTGAVYRVHTGGIEQLFKKDKVLLPVRNIAEYKLYRSLVSAVSMHRRRIDRKLAWNYFYLGFIQIKQLMFMKSIDSLVKASVCKIKSWY